MRLPRPPAFAAVNSDRPRNDKPRFLEGKLRLAGLTDRIFVHHTPCHLIALGGNLASIEVLKQLAGIDVKELSGCCCGIAGTFGMQKKNYDLSIQIGRKLAEKIESSGADVVLTECSTCKMQIEQMAGKRVEHPIKVLAEAFGLL